MSTALQPHLERHRDSNTATLLGWSAVHQGDLAAGLTWFAQALSWTPGHDEAAYGIALVHRQQGDLASAERLARQWLDTAPRWRRFLGEFLLARAGESRQQGQYIGSLQLLEAGESYEIPQPAARLMAAWNALDLRQLPAAVAGFTAVLEQDPASKDAAYGLVLASRQHGDLARAEAVARQWEATSAPMRDALGAILLERAGVSHRQQQYAESQRFLEASAPYQPLTRAGEMLHGWNAYHLGQYEVAAASFVALHQALPDEESAQGVWRSYVQAQFWAPLGALAQRQPGPLTTLWRQHWSQRHADRSLWRAAEHIAPGTLASLRGLDSPLVSLGGLVRDKSGTSGLSALQLQLAPLATTTLSYDTVHTFGLRVGRLRLDSGALGPHAPIGHLPDTPMPYRVAPTTALDNSVEAHVRYSQEGWLTPYAELGLTPTGGKVPSFPIWRLGLLQQTEAGHWRLEGFSQPVRESLLSYTGLADPYSGTVWGRVLRTGIGLSTYRSLGERWGMAGQLSASWLRGQRVAENWQVGAQVSVGYNVAPPGFTYLTVGPQLGLEHYAKNLSHFTLGHGGYFSPEYQGQIGLAAHFLTTEGRWFLAKGSLSLGWQSHRDSRSPVFPLMPDGRTFAAQTESGIVFASEVQALARLSAHWQLGVGIALRQTATFDDKAFSLFVQYGLQARRAVLSSDFPSHVFQTAY
ncbi:MAG: tetratricopeptide repeat protein [Candidatus Tectomicrobia bacterium]|uniref:Tetratricopeptide repeat protein n=1 Tax=Tectimicrobiota bacterium TaxID=2528274 RepID=A0A937VZU3_UNCTE|nr:tetratricopeptide repeat protein [Candidatus Tectomicrobia bacterium]